MALTDAQKGLLITGDTLLAIGFFFMVFGHIHRAEHKSHGHFMDTLKKAGGFIIAGLILLLAGVYSKKKDAKKAISAQNVVLTVFVIALYAWGVLRSKDPVVTISIAGVVGIFTGIMFNTIMFKTDNPNVM